MNILAVLTAIVLLLISALHFYWAFGGTYGIQAAAPKLPGMTEIKIPKKITFIVACMIACLAALALMLVSDLSRTNAFLTYLGFFISFVFITRAIGEFRYLGFFKRVYDNEFASKDTYIFSPLCLLLGICFAALASFANALAV